MVKEDKATLGWLDKAVGHHAGNAGGRSVRYGLKSTTFKCYLSMEFVTGEQHEQKNSVASPCTWSFPLHCVSHGKIFGHFCITLLVPKSLQWTYCLFCFFASRLFLCLLKCHHGMVLSSFPPLPWFNMTFQHPAGRA